MHYLKSLLDAYENSLDKVGIIERDEKGNIVTLLPPYHSIRQAHIQITLDTNGNFIFAEVRKQYVPIPTTEASESRSGSAVFPHPLHDQLRYISTDFIPFATHLKDSDKEKALAGQTLYQEGLKKWLSTDWHPKVQAIMNYIEKGCLTRDLIHAGVLPTDENGDIISKWTGNAKEKPPLLKNISGEIEKTLVCFDVVETLDEFLNKLHTPIWEDRSVQESFISFSRTQYEQRGFCYLTGEESIVTMKHPKGIRHAADGTKLISSNTDFLPNSDNMFPKEFIVRTSKKTGETTVIAAPATISVEASHKAHSMLRWLIQKQAIRFGNKVIVLWGTKQPLVNPMLDRLDSSIFENLSFDDESAEDVSQVIAERLRKAFKGHDVALEDVEDDINILILDSMSDNGRLQVLGYRTLLEHDYLNRIEEWQEKTRWLNSKGDGYYLPSFYQMAHAVFGKNYSTEDKAKQIKRFYNDMTMCVMDGKNIPKHYIDTMVRRVLNPQSMSGKSYEEKQRNWRNSMRIACSMLRRYHYDTEKGVKVLELNTQNTNRDYLFGRLLAVAQVIEKRAQAGREIRQTNAELYINTYAQRPMKTWQHINGKLQPYLNRLGAKRGYYSKLINEILCLFEEGDFSNKPLNGLFLQGYALQEAEFYKKSKASSTSSDNEESINSEDINIPILLDLEVENQLQ